MRTLHPSPTKDVVLRGGVLVSVDALRLAWELEDRGLSLVANGTNLATVPAAGLTSDERRLLQHHHDDLLTIVRYVEALE